MRHPRDFLEVDRRPDFDVLQRVKIVHRHVQFFREELRRVRHERRAAREEQALRHRAALLAAVELNRLIHLDVQPRHHLPRNLRDQRLIRIIRLLVRAPQTHETRIDLQFFRHRIGQLGLVGKIRRDRIRADVDAPREHLPLLENHHIAGLGPDVQQHRALLDFPVIEPKCVAQRRRSRVDQLQRHAGRLATAEKPIHHIVLDRDQQHLQLPGRRRSQNLIIPHHFLQWEWHVLLRLVLNDLRDLVRIHLRELHELREHRRRRRAQIQPLRGKSPTRNRLGQRLEQHLFPRVLLHPLLPQRRDDVSQQPQRPRFVRLKLGELERARTKVRAKK